MVSPGKGEDCRPAASAKQGDREGRTLAPPETSAQITALRRVLAQGGSGESYVVTVPGRDIALLRRSRDPPAGRCSRKPFTRYKGHNLPGRLTRPIGRADVIAMVSSRLQRGRFITITGPGGIGKTTVVLPVADKASHRDGTWFVDLAPVNHTHSLWNALAQAACPVALRAGDLPQRSATRRCCSSRRREIRAVSGAPMAAAMKANCLFGRAIWRRVCRGCVRASTNCARTGSFGISYIGKANSVGDRRSNPASPNYLDSARA
jgi:hypothetical protein